VIEDGRQAERIRPDPLPAPAPAQTSPSIEPEKPETSGQRAPDFGVSATRFRLIKSERIEADAEESEENEPARDDDSWTWNGADWNVTETPGSTRTRKFVLRLKGTDGKYHYARSCSLNFEEFNRRFAGRRGVTDRRLKPVRENDYDKFKTVTAKFTPNVFCP
jgi:hypothetical protein